ncbi:MAG: sulfotransferase [Vicinamibacterales bacterium]
MYPLVSPALMLTALDLRSPRAEAREPLVDPSPGTEAGSAACDVGSVQLRAVDDARAATAASAAGARLVLVAGLESPIVDRVGRIFDSHPDTLVARNPEAFVTLSVPEFPDAGQDPRWRSAVDTFVDALPLAAASWERESVHGFSKSYRPVESRHRVHQLWRAGARVVTQITGRDSAPDRAATLTLPAAGPVRWVWASTHSQGRAGLLTRLLPYCRAFVVTRNPLAYVASALAEVRQGESAGAAPDADRRIEEFLQTEHAQQYGLTRSVLRRLHPVERLTWWWMMTTEFSLVEARDSSSLTIVRYEDLCRDAHATARRLFTSAGLAWPDQTAAFLQSAPPDDGDSPRRDDTSRTPRRSRLTREDVTRIRRVVDEGAFIRRLYALDVV